MSILVFEYFVVSYMLFVRKDLCKGLQYIKTLTDDFLILVLYQEIELMSIFLFKLLAALLRTN